MSLKTLTLFISMISLAACDNSGGDPAPDPEAAINVTVAGRAAPASPEDTFLDLGLILTEPGTGGSGDGAVFSGDTAFSYVYGLAPSTTGEPDQLIGRSLFAVDTTAYDGDLPVSGSAFYGGVFEFDHVTGIGETENGTFSEGTATKTGGNLFFTVEFDTATFTGQGVNETAETVLTMEGQVGGDGTMTGTVVAAGMNAELDGIIFGDPKQLSGAAGAFVGNTETELLIGGFAAEGAEP